MERFFSKILFPTIVRAIGLSFLISDLEPLFLKIGITIDSFQAEGVNWVFPHMLKNEAKTARIATPPNLYASAFTLSAPGDFPDANLLRAFSTSS